MIACSLVFHLLVLGVLTVPGEPVVDAADREMFRVFQEAGQGSMTPAQVRRMRFWGWYTGHRALMHKMQDGYEFADDFNDPRLRKMRRPTAVSPDDAPPAQEGLWGIWKTDPNIHIGIEEGRLVVRGTSSSRPAPLNFNGLVGKPFRNTDVVVVADMKTVSPDEGLPGTHVGLVHLCGSTPDLFHELGFGRVDDDVVGWSHHQVEGLAPDAEHLEHRPAFGDEHERFYSIRLEHDAATELSRAWVERDGEWLEVGEARKVVMSTAKVELKVNVPEPGMEIETWFDNCRLYGRPQTHPVRFLVYNSEVGPTEIEGVRVELFLDGSATPTTSGLTDGSGWADVTLPADRAYPTAARVRFTLTTGETWDREIDQVGLDGLYPADVWVARLNMFDMAGDDGWWKRTREESLRPATETDAK